jgi:signal transduction histidine kinase
MNRYVLPPTIPAQDLIPMIAHDLRTPITGIKGYTQLALRQSALPARVEAYLESVLDEANQLASLLEDLVLVNQCEREVVAIHPTMVDLGQLVTRVSTATELKYYPARSAANGGAQVVAAYCDPELTQRALTRLAEFAVKYCRSSDAGQIGTYKDDERSYVWIATQPDPENGSALPRFLVRSDSTDDHELGRHDLRLFICVRLAELQSGSVVCGAGPGDSRIFYLALPSGSYLATPARGG